MNKKEDSIKVTLEKYQNDKINSNFVLVVLSYKTQDFYKYNRSISKFYQKLTNSKSAVGKLSNREWYKNILNGFYHFQQTPDTTLIYIAFNPLKQINVLDLKTRIKKIKPFPESIAVGINDYELLNRYFSKLFDYNSGLEVFGELKRKKPQT
ncbi:hypothetical protein GCM10011508_07920 [Flavobacterium lutivivi]|nr:hypothetical protein GCM10011508_07920 [Flavobacterium lutivivi]